MTPWQKEIAASMPVGRWLFAREIYRAASLPPGWQVSSVVAQLKELPNVERDTVRDGGNRIGIYRRTA